jgi:hypothetical protein
MQLNLVVDTRRHSLHLGGRRHRVGACNEFAVYPSVPANARRQHDRVCVDHVRREGSQQISDAIATALRQILN